MSSIKQKICRSLYFFIGYLTIIILKKKNDVKELWQKKQDANSMNLDGTTRNKGIIGFMNVRIKKMLGEMQILSMTEEYPWMYFMGAECIVVGIKMKE
jgi:hypothetical protein